MSSAFLPSSPGPAPAGHKAANGLSGGLASSGASSETGAEDDEHMTFESTSHEAAYFRDKYRRVADFLEETRAELDEFQLSSKELEDELERELAATEKQQAELKDRIKRLEAEKEEWKAKHISAQKMHSSTVSAMQREMDNLRSERDRTLVALRDLEMGNDELERNERVAVSSLLDLESKYNRAIEEKTLLEQEIVQKTEVEEDSQRLKDELRDANDQIAILRDQLARTNLPTPPSSISVPLSPSRSNADLPDPDTGDISTTTVEPPSSPSRTRLPSGLPRKQGSNGALSRSSTLSNIPNTVSPTLRRATMQIPGTPLGGGMSRSNTARNLIGVSGIPGSPSLARSRSGIPQASSPMRVPSEPKYPLSRAAKMVTDLRRRIKATDDRMGGKATRRVVSNPTTDIVSDASKPAPTKPVNSRLAALANDPLHTPQAGNSTLSVLSPNGWILVDDENVDQSTPANPTGRAEPTSPIDSMHIQHQQPRAVSGASTATTSRGLPSRPGIPSPLMTLAAARQGGAAGSHGTPTPKNSVPVTSSNLAKSTSGTGGMAARPPSRSALSQSSRLPSRGDIPPPTARPPSRSAMAPSARSVSRTGMRPMSPSVGGTGMMSPSSYGRSGARPPPGPGAGPNTLQSLTSSLSTSTSRPTTALGTRATALGRGPPPSAMSTAAQRRQLSMSTSSSTPAVSSTPSRIPTKTGAEAAAEIRRRRSSMGPGKDEVPVGTSRADDEGYFNLMKLQSQSQVATPGRTPPAVALGHSSGPGGKGRPASVPHFGTPPPEMPRIPSVHLREKRRTIQQG